MKYDLSSLKLLIEDFRTLLNQEREYKKTHSDYGSSGPHYFQYDGTPQDYIKKNNEAISPVNRIRLQRHRNSLADNAKAAVQQYIAKADSQLNKLNTKRPQNLSFQQRKALSKNKKEWNDYKSNINNQISSIRSGAAEVFSPGRASPIGNTVALNMNQIKNDWHLNATKAHEGEHINQFNTARQIYGKKSGAQRFMTGYATPELQKAAVEGDMVGYHTAPAEYYANQAIWNPVDKTTREQIVRQAVEGDKYTGPKINISREQSKKQLDRFMGDYNK